MPGVCIHSSYFSLLHVNGNVIDLGLVTDIENNSFADKSLEIDCKVKLLLQRTWHRIVLLAAPRHLTYKSTKKM